MPDLRLLTRSSPLPLSMAEPARISKSTVADRACFPDIANSGIDVVVRVGDFDAPVDQSEDDIPTRVSDYRVLEPGDPGFDYSRMNPAELNVIMNENLDSQNADKLDLPEVDSD